MFSTPAFQESTNLNGFLILVYMVAEVAWILGLVGKLVQSLNIRLYHFRYNVLLCIAQFVVLVLDAVTTKYSAQRTLSNVRVQSWYMGGDRNPLDLTIKSLLSQRKQSVWGLPGVGAVTTKRQYAMGGGSQCLSDLGKRWAAPAAGRNMCLSVWPNEPNNCRSKTGECRVRTKARDLAECGPKSNTYRNHPISNAKRSGETPVGGLNGVGLGDVKGLPP